MMKNSILSTRLEGTHLLSLFRKRHRASSLHHRASTLTRRTLWTDSALLYNRDGGRGHLHNRQSVICLISNPEVEADDDSLIVRRKDDTKDGLKGTVEKWLQKARGRASAAQYTVPDHWYEQIQQTAPRRLGLLEKYYDRVAKINSLEPECREMTDAELKAKTELFKKRLFEREPLDSVLVEAFAVVRETSRRVLNMRHYDCQLVGGMILNDGQIAEMGTGEGKTLVATLPVYLNACAGKTVHVITVNEYLADRDAKWMGRIYEFLGLSVTAIKTSMQIDELKEAYTSDIIYVTAHKLCFDYLHDWTALSLDEMSLSSLDYGIIDEVDSVLIDEARIPLRLSSIVSKVSSKIKIAAEVIYDLLDAEKYGLLNTFANQMTMLETFWAQSMSSKKIPVADVLVVKETVVNLMQIIDETEFLPKELTSEMFRIELEYVNSVEFLRDPKQFVLALRLLLQFQEWATERMLYVSNYRSSRATITEYGANVLKAALEKRGESVGGTSGVALWEPAKDGEPWGPFLANAIKARDFFRLGKNYIVVDGAVTIVDASTGRTKNRSRWDELLHQAVEAKEQVYQERGIDREGVDSKNEIKILPPDDNIATITFQVFFQYYSKLAGMSGTALSEEPEFFESYGLSVVHVPTHRPLIRVDHSPVIFFKSEARLRYLITQLIRCDGVRPVLIGTNSVEESEYLMDRLKQNWVDENDLILWDGNNRYEQGKLLMLNARPEVVKEESHIIAQAGLPGMVTVATRMAGRGTDILLGGNPKGLVENALHRCVLQRCAPELKRSSSLRIPEFDIDGPTSVTAPASIKGLMMSALARGTTSEEVLETDDDADRLVTHVINIAENYRNAVLQQLKISKESTSLQLVQLDFERHIRLSIAHVLAENESTIEKESPFVQSLIKFTLYAWLWFDQRCESYREQVKSAGGLLVIGMSVADSKRIENQLRGRSGRQGDPGDSIMLADISDQLFQQWNLGAIRSVTDWQSIIVDDCLEGPVAQRVIANMRREIQHLYKSARRDVAVYDEIEEEFRQQYQFLKHIVLEGSDEERTQLIYAWIQDMATDLVEKFTNGRRHPNTWKLWKSNEDHDDEALTVKEDSLEEQIDKIFNPPSKTIVFPFQNIRKQQYPSQERFVEAGVKGQDEMEELIKGICRVPFVRVVPFTCYQKEDLSQALRTGSLPKASAADHFLTGRLKLTLEIRRSLALHKKLIHQKNSSTENRRSEPYMLQVRMLEEYVGELMIMLLEERNEQLVRDVAREESFSRQWAEHKLRFLRQSVMLNLLSILWSDFQKSITRLQQTSLLISVRKSHFEEFSIQAHKQFAANLRNYRQAVVLSMITPRINLLTTSDIDLWADLMQSLAANKSTISVAETNSMEALSAELKAIYSEEQ